MYALRQLLKLQRVWERCNHTHKHTCMHTHRINAHMNKYIHACMHTAIYTWLSAVSLYNLYTCIHAHTNTWPCTEYMCISARGAAIFIHAYIHTCIHTTHRWLSAHLTHRTLQSSVSILHACWRCLPFARRTFTKYWRGDVFLFDIYTLTCIRCVFVEKNVCAYIHTHTHTHTYRYNANMHPHTWVQTTKKYWRIDLIYA